MHKRQVLFLLLLSSVVVSGCSVPQRRAFPQGDINTGMLVPPPSGMFLLPPNGGPMGDIFRKKMQDACLSGILQTGSDFFKELTKNTTDKEAKLLFIKGKLESIANDASAESKKKINEELKIINTLIQEVKDREQEFKSNPNKICTQKGEGLTKMNKKMREGMLGLSENISEIREHERKEGFFKNTIEKIFFQENSKEDREEDEQAIRDSEDNNQEIRGNEDNNQEIRGNEDNNQEIRGNEDNKQEDRESKEKEEND